jgi:hypothetical protein
MNENLLDHLQEQGYTPQDTFGTFGIDDEWYELTVPDVGTVRLCVYPDDCYRAEMFVFDPNMICEWDVKHSPSAPDAVIIAGLRAAEQILADRYGHPVTPEQETADVR